MTYFKITFYKGGAHFHATLWSRSQAQQTWNSCGPLCFRETEWQHFRDELRVTGILFEERVPRSNPK